MVTPQEATPGERPTQEPAATPLAIDGGELPWSYGEDRITAIVRDPDSAYLYWEITDGGIAAARGRLGAAGEHGWCNLRVYDTTGRSFDGINANDYFDVRVGREDREYFLMIRRPASTMHVEVGIKTHEGYFQPIARSGAAAFPRSSPSPDGSVAWMTVTSDDAPPCAAPFRSRYAGALPPLPGRVEPDVWNAGYQPVRVEERYEPPPAASTWLVHRHVERHVHVERWWPHGPGWKSAVTFARWEHFDPARIAIELLGEMPSRIHVEGGEMLVLGPWRVTIQSFESEPTRRVLSTWSVRWVRATTPTIERWEHTLERQVFHATEREQVVAGASERHRLLERGASELWRIGGSERMWLGASEWVASGSSETLMRGASQLAFLGASVTLGASERLGASEQLGASERMGASERHILPMGERWAQRPGDK
jgi:hypothetical protein